MIYIHQAFEELFSWYPPRGGVKFHRHSHERPVSDRRGVVCSGACVVRRHVARKCHVGRVRLKRELVLLEGVQGGRFVVCAVHRCILSAPVRVPVLVERDHRSRLQVPASQPSPEICRPWGQFWNFDTTLEENETQNAC